MWVKIDQHTPGPYSNTGGTLKRFGGHLKSPKKQVTFMYDVAAFNFRALIYTGQPSL